MGEQLMENFLIKRAFLTPDRTAIEFEGMQFSFKEVYDRAVDFAGRMAGQGIQKNDFAAVLLKNSADSAIILYALQLLGVKAVILNSRLTASELSWQVQDSDSAYLITEDSFISAAEEVKESCPAVIVLQKEKLHTLPYSEALIVRELDLNDVCTVMYTSGTTGNPKGVLQTYGNHWWSAAGSALNLGLAENDSWLCTVPLFHISGYSILMRSVIYGINIHILERFQAREVIEVIEKRNITVMSVVSTMLTQILEELGQERLPKHFRCMLLGGGPAPLSLLESCKEKSIPVYQTYGMTETSSQVATLSPEYSLTKLGSAGKPLFPAQMKIMNNDEIEASPGEAGEIIVKGFNVTIGYLNREKDTQEKIKNGWLATGDLGYMDEDGFLFVLDRRSDLIISGGENVYPAEIEGVLTAHPEIADAGVIAMEDKRWGQVPIAFIQASSKTLTEEDIKTYCLGRLAKYKIPKNIYFIEEIPRNAAKKILRRELRKLIDA